MKKLILFSTPFGFPTLLLLLVLNWFGVYENQLTEPKLLLISFLVGEIVLFLWFYYVTKERLTGGSYSKHFLTSVFVRFIVVVSAVILFSYDLAIAFSIYFEGAIFGMVGVVTALTLTAVFIVVGEVLAEQVLEAKELKVEGT